MLTLCFGEAKNRFAGLALTVNVRFAVAEFIFAKLKKSAEFIIFASASVDIARHHSKQHDKEKYKSDSP